jgi:hypothetical protein
MALACLGFTGQAWAQPCACEVNSCATVLVTQDNHTDLGCEPVWIGQSLPDADGDGLPDACDACACAPNPLDPETGRAAACPPTQPDPPDPRNPPETPETPETPRIESDEPARPPPIACVNGEVTGVPGRVTLWFVRPRAVAFTRFEADSTSTAAGAHVWAVRNLDVDECETVVVGGKASVKRVEPPSWYLHAGAFASANMNLPQVNFDAVLGADVGVDYHAADQWWSLGPSLHVLTLLGATEPTPLQLGLGPRFGLLDVVALTPFVQVDLANRAVLSYGAWLTFDWGMFTDLGIELDVWR